MANIDCKWVNINFNLYNHLQTFATPCFLKDKLTDIQRIEKNGTVYKYNIVDIDIDAKNLNNPYLVKKMEITNDSIREKMILMDITRDILTATAPKMYPFVYQSVTCVNEMHLLLQPFQITITGLIAKVSGGAMLTIQWWIELLYQTAKAVQYLESKMINHNSLNFDTITLQFPTDNFNHIAVMITEFGNATTGTTSEFILGKDLFNFAVFIHGKSDFIVPKPVKNILIQYTMQNQSTPISGEIFSKWLEVQFTFLQN